MRKKQHVEMMNILHDICSLTRRNADAINFLERIHVELCHIDHRLVKIVDILECKSEATESVFTEHADEPNDDSDYFFELKYKNRRGGFEWEKVKLPND